MGPKLRYPTVCLDHFAGVVLQPAFATFFCSSLAVDIPAWDAFVALCEQSDVAVEAGPLHARSTGIRKLDHKLQVWRYHQCVQFCPH